MASISVCMIVKNEGAVLARCLDCLAGIADEIVVVDTGSLDATKEIAAKYTDRIYDFKWVDDFAAARNYSLEKATCDFVYVADADELIDEENRRRFLQLKEALLPEVEVVEMAYENQMEYSTTANFVREYRPKLFRRLRAFQFADPIHEALRTDPVVFRSTVVVQHRPTSDHGGRDLAHFARLVARGDRFSERLEMMYARELFMVGTPEDFYAAAPYFKMVRADPLRRPPAQRRAACVLVKVAALQADTAALLRFAGPELVGTPPAEICCCLADYFLEAGDESQAADWYSAALSGAEPELAAVYAGRVPLLGMAACFARAGDEAAAADYREKAAAWQPEELQAES